MQNFKTARKLFFKPVLYCTFIQLFWANIFKANSIFRKQITIKLLNPMVLIWKEKFNLFFFGSDVLSNLLQVKPVCNIILGVFFPAKST